MLSQDVLNISHNQITISISPQKSEVKAVEIYQLLRRIKNNQLMEIDENIMKAADMINQSTRNNAEQGDIVIAKATHATLSIDVVKEDMKAIVTIEAPWGGEHISLEDLNQRLLNHGIIYGLCVDSFKAQIVLASKLKSGQQLSFDAALGLAPVHGEDAQFTILVKTMEDRQLKPQQRSHGKVDMHDLGDVETVAINTPLVKRTPPTPGQAGFTVFGIELPTTPGQSIPFQVNDGTKISSNDENSLISTIEGIPRVHKGSIAIDDVLTVKNVDITFGNIDFQGNVVVTGDICEGMTVSSQGDITVAGCVNSATLYAKGNIKVAQGIFGKKKAQDSDQLTCNVTAGGTVSAQYIQYSQINTGIDVRAQTQLLHSQVSAGDSIVVANKSLSKGTIFGGDVQAVKKISAVELGGNAGSKTLLTLNADLDNKRDSIDNLQQALAKEFPILQQLIAAHDKVSSIKSKQEQTQLLNKLKRNIDKKVAFIVNTKKEIASLESHIDEKRSTMSIIAKRTLFDGVHIKVDNLSSQTLKQYQAIKITVKDEAISISPLTAD